jgi:MoaA/NifB/PqqE/SkfB family radical SAM enzyme
MTVIDKKYPGAIRGILLLADAPMKTPSFVWNILKKQILKQPQDYAQGCYRAGSIVLILTSRCNFLCRHCLRDLKETSDLPFEIAEKVIDRAPIYNYRSIGFVGGEPLLYPRFRDLVELCVKKNISFAVITNGSLFKEHADLFVRHRDRVHMVKFSLESLDPKKHDAIRQSGSFAKLMEAFEICRAERIPYTICATIGPHNIDEVYDLAIFAKKKKMSHIVLTTMVPCPRTETNHLVLNPQERHDLWKTIQGITRILKFPVHPTAEIRAWNNIQMCAPQTLSEVTVNSQGDVALCCHLANHDLESVRRKTIAASLKDKTFDDALIDLSRYCDRFQRERIADFRVHPNPDDIDFNSCFYCIKKFSETTPSLSSTAA